MYKYYKPFHSDFLIHWTGIDIEEKFNTSWTSKHLSTTNEEVGNAYLERLKYILKYGLWMTYDENDKELIINDKKIQRPNPSRVCFTELKLSYIRSHAANYGRLGIGFKSFFVFDRLGSPMSYFQDKRINWFISPLFNNSDSFNKDEYYSCFLKKMTKRSGDGTLEYKYYDESEWRIIYSKEIETKLQDVDMNNIPQYFIKPSQIPDDSFKQYIKKSSKKPEYLIPMKNKWFAMIIYPSLSVKVKSENDEEIRQLINTIKPDKSNVKISDSNPASYESNSKPFEIDLDSCRNF